MHPFQRNYERITTAAVFDEWPVHFSGSAAFFYNDSDDQTSTITVEDSDDGTNFAILPFSTSAASGLLSVNIAPKSYVSILFTTNRRYLRVSLDEYNPDGVYMHLAQWMPRNPEFEGTYS
jgi:hypothetical protein